MLMNWNGSGTASEPCDMLQGDNPSQYSTQPSVALGARDGDGACRRLHNTHPAAGPPCDDAAASSKRIQPAYPASAPHRAMDKPAPWPPPPNAAGVADPNDRVATHPFPFPFPFPPPDGRPAGHNSGSVWLHSDASGAHQTRRFLPERTSQHESRAALLQARNARAASRTALPPVWRGQ